MRTVTRAEIETVWDHFSKLDPKSSESVVKQFLQEQPALGLFLCARDDQSAEEGEESLAIEIALTAWKTLTEAAGRRLKSIAPEQVDAIEDANMKALENLEKASEMETTDFARNSVERYNQRELVGFAVEVLMSGHEENPELAPEGIGMDLLAVKTVIDCLDQHG